MMKRAEIVIERRRPMRGVNAYCIHQDPNSDGAPGMFQPTLVTRRHLGPSKPRYAGKIKIAEDDRRNEHFTGFGSDGFSGFRPGFHVLERVQRALMKPKVTDRR